MALIPASYIQNIIVIITLLFHGNYQGAGNADFSAFYTINNKYIMIHGSVTFDGSPGKEKMHVVSEAIEKDLVKNTSNTFSKEYLYDFGEKRVYVINRNKRTIQKLFMDHSLKEQLRMNHHIVLDESRVFLKTFLAEHIMAKYSRLGKKDKAGYLMRTFDVSRGNICTSVEMRFKKMNDVIQINFFNITSNADIEKLQVPEWGK